MPETRKANAEFAQTDVPAQGTMAVDWQQRVDFDRLRRYRVQRVRQAMDEHGLGAVLPACMTDRSPAGSKLLTLSPAEELVVTNAY